eukprot:COSAG06_NODE_9705_length_1839_cov_2.377586_2_plen_98_part_00
MIILVHDCHNDLLIITTVHAMNDRGEARLNQRYSSSFLSLSSEISTVISPCTAAQPTAHHECQFRTPSKFPHPIRGARFLRDVRICEGRTRMRAVLI